MMEIFFPKNSSSRVQVCKSATDSGGQDSEAGSVEDVLFPFSSSCPQDNRSVETQTSFPVCAFFGRSVLGFFFLWDFPVMCSISVVFPILINLLVPGVEKHPHNTIPPLTDLHQTSYRGSNQEPESGSPSVLGLQNVNRSMKSQSYQCSY